MHRSNGRNGARMTGGSTRVALRRWALALAVAALASLSALAAPAMAGITKEFEVFKDCPYENPEVSSCIYSTTTSGEFTIGNKTVPVNKTVILQGGLSNKTEALVPAKDGNTLSKTPLEVPGGIIGIEILGPLTEVTATAELAGTVLVNIANTATRQGTAVTLPLKVKLDNPLLLNACYVGSDSEPFTPHLTTGTTSPPGPNKPIEGSPGTLTFAGDGKINVFSGTSLVDNAFAVPGANGCAGLLSLVVDPSVDLIVGLPAPSGKNTAVLSGSLEQTGANIVRTQLKLPEIGRCVKATSEKVGRETVSHGLYGDSGCTFEVPQHVGKFEWEPGAVAKHFSGAGKTTTLETVGKKKVTCTGSSTTGEYTSTKTASLSITLTGCVNAVGKEPCTSSGASSGELRTGTMATELGFIKDVVTPEGPRAALGWDLAQSPAFISATCGASKEALSVTGSVIAPITPIDKMVPAYSLAFKAKAGLQSPESLEEQPKDVLSARFGSGSGEQAGLNGAIKVTNQEKLEFKGLSG
ncbi:MAG TPA: hypothetical protein VFW29_03130 [Solirubrobacteraceae bacterium]|nr:hypothetical protein [Solirubrobacteraceae bacterium]